MTHKDEFEELLREALSEYRDAEPLAGLDSRLLARLRTQTTSRSGLWFRWSLAAACLAALVVATWIGMTHRTPQTAAPEAESVAQPVQPQGHQPAAHVESPIVLSRSASGHAGIPHGIAAVEEVRTSTNQTTPDVFPVPVPLTAEERAFVAALERHPDAAPATSQSDSKPVIALIEIKPLSTTDGIPGENQ